VPRPGRWRPPVIAVDGAGKGWLVKTRRLAPPHLVLVAACLAAACTNSGLTKYDEIPPEEPADAEVPVIDDEECATQCNVALSQFAFLEEGEEPCYLDCAVGIGVGFDGEASGSILWSVIEAEADGDLQIGGSCNLVLECGESCARFFSDCARVNVENEEYFAACVDEYEQCRRDTQCVEALTNCQVAAEDTRQECLDDGYAPDYCQDIYNEANVICGCVYNACLLEESGQECFEATPPPMPAPPTSPSPGVWNVSRAYLDAQLARLPEIGVEVFLIPRVDAQQVLRGVELRSIRNGDALYSLGLRNGDLVRSIGGRTMEAIMDDIAVLQGVFSQAQVQVAIRRDGANKVLTYKIQN
jgi:hypothetical protein